jgi:hypothetical protein
MSDASKSTVSLSDLLVVAPSENAFSQDGRWYFHEIIEALKSKYLNSFGGYDDEEFDFLKSKLSSRFTLIHTIFDIPHDSDEMCSARILSLDGAPVVLFKRIGDRSDYSDGLEVLDIELTKELVRLVLDYHIQQSLQTDVLPATLESITEGSQYIIPIAGDVFIVDSPKWALGFPRLFEKHSAWLVDDDGALLRVDSFKRWLTEKPRWSDDLGNHAIVETVAGDVTINCRQILFTLTKEPLSMDALQESARILRSALAEKEPSESDRPQ